jgi:hypothetical protein
MTTTSMFDNAKYQVLLKRPEINNAKKTCRKYNLESTHFFSSLADDERANMLFGNKSPTAVA